MPDPTGRVSHIHDFHRGFSWKPAARMASTGNLTLSGLQTIDGVVGAAEDIVLVKDNTTGSQNGLYWMKSGAWVRHASMDQDASSAVPAEEVMGAVVEVIAGTTNGGTFWRTTNATAPTLGSTTITWTQFASGAPSGAAGGDLSGTYPNPSVVDDSHNHTAATLPAVSSGVDHQHIGDIQFSGDGSTTAFELPAAPFDAYSVQAYVAGVRLDVVLSGTLLTTMTFGSAPASGTNNILVDLIAVAA